MSNNIDGGFVKRAKAFNIVQLVVGILAVVVALSVFSPLAKKMLDKTMPEIYLAKSDILMRLNCHKHTASIVKNNCQHRSVAG